MKAPEGLSLPHQNMVCGLHKSLYVLKQASRQWHAKLTKALESKGLKQSNADPSLFTQRSNRDFIALLMYVDDVLLAKNNEEFISEMEKYLDGTFKTKDLGPAKYFLGLELARSHVGINLLQ